MDKYLSKIVIALLLIICIWYGRNLDSWGRNGIIKHDAISYYAYLPAALIFHDLSFEFMKDLPDDFEGRIWYGSAPNEKPVIRMTMGLSMLWLPFFLLAHALAHVLGLPTLGYSWPYSLSIFIAAVFYLSIGLIYLRRILLSYYSDLITAITLALVVAGTNLMYYVISEPGMPHVYGFSLITIFFFYTLEWIKKPTGIRSMILGVLAGLIVLIRPVNGLVVIFPALIGINSFSAYRTRVTKNWKYILIASFSALLIALPQLIYWKVQTGHILFNSYMDWGKFYFFQPKIVQGLVGFRKGWLIYTPVMFFALTGFFVMKKNAGEIKNAILIFLVIFIYIIFSWWCWWYGGSFGSRPMIETYGILALPLAASIAFLFQRRTWIKVLSGVVLVALIFLNQFQMGQYRTAVLHWDSMTKEAYQAIFLKNNPPEGYRGMLRSPDYTKALAGEKE